jgi:hypothetical protein
VVVEVMPPAQAQAQAPTPVIAGHFDDSRLQALNDTVDRMGRQLKNVAKLLNQQQTTPTPTPSAVAPTTGPNGDQLVMIGETVDRMGRELRGVLNLLIQQQATLARLTEGRAAAVPPPAPPPPAPTPSRAAATLDAPGARMPAAYGSGAPQARTNENPGASLPGSHVDQSSGVRPYPQRSPGHGLGDAP